MTEIIAISKQGKNVGTCTDPNDFIFHSGYNTFKILSEGTASINIGNNAFEEQQYTIAHGKDYTPFVFAFCKFSDGRVCTVGNRMASGEPWFSSFSVDGTNLNFYFSNNSGTKTVNVKYYITEVPI